MGGRSQNASRNSRNNTETVSDFLNRAVGDNDEVRIYQNDAEAIVGTKAQVINSKRLVGLYFAGFSLKNGKVEIQATSQADTARRRIEQRRNR